MLFIKQCSRSLLFLAVFVVFIANLALAQATDNKEKYNQTLNQAEKLFFEKKYKEAKVAFQDAQKLMPTESHPKTRIGEINKILGIVDPVDGEYKQAIAKADALYKSNKYAEALEAYKTANDLLPDQQYATDRIFELHALIKKNENLEKNYQSAITKGTQYFGDKKYELAITEFETALTLKPGESVPTAKIAEIKKITATIADYQKAIGLADELYSNKEYEKAKAAYLQAQSVKPDEKYPQSMISRIDETTANIAGEEQARQQLFDQTVAAGDGFFRSQEYSEARVSYESALKIKPSESYPRAKINEIENLLANIELQEKQYAQFIVDGDKYFNDQNLKAALVAYRGAEKLKPEETYPKAKVAEITALLTGIEQIEQSYQSAIAKADQEFGAKNYDFAKAEYQNASAIKPNESYPKTKIAEITTLLAGIQQSEQNYQSAIAKADQEFSAKNYDLAKASYENASAIKPDESYPKTKIAEITTLLAGIQQTEQNYQSAIAKADQEFGVKNYDLAKSSYENASAIKPDESYPKTKIAEITTLLEGIQQVEQNYLVAITKADQEFSARNYDLAKASYENASAIKPEESYPKTKIAEITTLLAGIQQTEQNYQSAIARADQEFSAKNYDLAKASYENASTIKPDESYPKTKIAEITTLLAGIQQSEQNYQSAIAKADQEFSAKNYDLAKASYENASAIKPDESYPKTKIAEITTLLAGIQQTEQSYQSAVAKADQEFSAKNYDLAKTDYQNASAIKPEESYPKTKIAEITTLLEGIQQVEQNYLVAITKADQEFSAKNYDLANADYQNASTIKPDESYPKTKIAEITTLLAGIQQTEQNYQSAIAKADQEFGAKNYDLAKSSYENASSIKPDESYPKTKIAEITTLLAGIQQTEQNYQSAIAKADQEFSAKNYDLAKAEYQNASTIKPEESYPKTKIAEITTLLAGIQQTEQNYQSAIAKADQEFGVKNYDLAKSSYENASAIKPDESYPKTKIAEITTLLAGIQQTEQNYQSAIANADQEFSAKNYDLAKSTYENASAIKPNESYPKTKIAEITTLLAGIQQTEQNYQSAIANADQEFSAKNYDLAKASYENASAIKPEESYPKTKIAEITTLLAGIQQTEQNYQSAIANADQEFSAKNYDLAKAEYQNASTIKPEESYPKTKIAEITTLLAGIQQTEQNYQAAITKADQEFGTKNYDLAKSSYENASTIKPDESYPKTKIAEINALKAAEILAYEENRKNYDAFIASGNFQYDADNFHMARNSYNEALKLFPDEPYPKERLKDIEAILQAESERIQKEYNIAISEADRFFAGKVYDNAIEYYMQASGIKPDETYPIDRINAITKLIQENVVVDVLKQNTTIESGSLKQYDFEPVLRQGRKESYVIIKMKNLSDNDFRLFLNYGKGAAKNGGFVINIPKSENLRDYVIRVGGQYKWVSEDNNWISVQPEGGSAEISVIQISQE